MPRDSPGHQDVPQHQAPEVLKGSRWHQFLSFPITLIQILINYLHPDNSETFLTSFHAVQSQLLGYNHSCAPKPSMAP